MSETPMTRNFQAGDSVLHRPSGETWLLACDQERSYVYPAGWPECRASAADCVLVEAASEAERLATLGAVSHSIGIRASLARQQLADATRKDGSQ